jgi:hypothetical protein
MNVFAWMLGMIGGGLIGTQMITPPVAATARAELELAAAQAARHAVCPIAPLVGLWAAMYARCALSLCPALFGLGVRG